MVFFYSIGKPSLHLLLVLVTMALLVLYPDICVSRHNSITTCVNLSTMSASCLISISRAKIVSINWIHRLDPASGFTYTGSADDNNTIGIHIFIHMYISRHVFYYRLYHTMSDYRQDSISRVKGLSDNWNH
jgi:hypothetical protein